MLNYIFVIALIIPIVLSIIYSYTSDFQPQGRYIMGIIVPFTYFLVSGIEEVLERFVKSQKVKRMIVFMLIALLIIISFKAIFAYVIPTYKKL